MPVHDALMSSPEMAGAQTIRLSEADLPRLSRLCRSCSAFYELIEGQPASEATAAEILGPLDPKYAPGTKHVWGVEKGDKLIAVADLLQGYPSARDWCIGLLLVDPEHRQQGVGTRLCGAILHWMALHGASLVRLVVQQQNARARTFWERQGFTLEREDVIKSGRLESSVWILSRK